MSDRHHTITALIHGGLLDAELAGLLWQLLEGDLPLVVSGPPGARPAELAEALEQLVAAGAGTATGNRDGNGHAERQLWLLEEDSLESVLGHFSRPPYSLSDDQLRGLGIVLIVGQAEAGSRLFSAHYLRPVERDAAGHLQRRPPALLAAHDARADKLEHYGWAISGELADRLGLSITEFERSLHQRRALLDELSRAGRLEPEALSRGAGEFRQSRPH